MRATGRWWLCSGSQLVAPQSSMRADALPPPAKSEAGGVNRSTFGRPRVGQRSAAAAIALGSPRAGRRARFLAAETQLPGVMRRDAIRRRALGHLHAQTNG